MWKVWSKSLQNPNKKPFNSKEKFSGWSLFAKWLFSSTQLCIFICSTSVELSIKSCLSLNKQLNCGRMWMRHDLFSNWMCWLYDGKKAVQKNAQENNFRLLIRLPWRYVVGVKTSHSFAERCLFRLLAFEWKFIQSVVDICIKNPILIIRNEEDAFSVQSLKQNELKCSFGVSFNKSRFSHCEFVLYFFFLLFKSITTENTRRAFAWFLAEHIFL